MFGVIDNYIKDSSSNICDNLPCDHIERIRELYSVMGLYNETAIELIINCFLDQQVDFIRLMCESEMPIENIAKLTGFNGCSYEPIDQGCFDFCGTQRRRYTFDLCKPCNYTIFNDDFYLSVLKMSRVNKYPSRNNLSKIVNLFGWVVFYTSGYINIDIGGDDIAKLGSIIKTIPAPIGSKIRVISDCN